MHVRRLSFLFYDASRREFRFNRGTPLRWRAITAFSIIAGTIPSSKLYDRRHNEVLANLVIQRHASAIVERSREI